MHRDSPVDSLAVSRKPRAPKGAASSAAALDWRSLLPINIHTLCASTLLQFDLYYRPHGKAALTLYRNRNFPLMQADLDRLRDRGVGTLYIRSDEAADYRAYLNENVLGKENVAPVKRFQVLREATRAMFLEALGSKDVRRSVEIAASLGSQLVDTICRSKCTLFDIFHVMTHDYGTFTHALNVSAFALLLAKALGIEDEQELVRIGQGGLLHDIGKQHVPTKILEKPGPLDPAERAILMKHPSHGFRDLAVREELAWPQLMMIYQHHERCDGRGYPTAAIRNDIHPYARLCALADVTDALLRDRPYRKASLKSDVVAYLDRMAGSAFDEEMTRCWLKVLTTFD